ncbi:hypothetical protein Avbf_10735 [Armadillidium vulgare]|nr:hypothetical protein Avbf_10735 [Armadillidium vulgare]
MKYIFNQYVSFNRNCIPQNNINHFGLKIDDKLGQASISQAIVGKSTSSEECRSGFSVRKSLRSTLKSKTQIKFQM